MKLQCPMSITYISGDIESAVCLGVFCAAYEYRDKKTKDEPTYGGNNTIKCSQWKCAALPQEVWHDVDESK